MSWDDPWSSDIAPQRCDDVLVRHRPGGQKGGENLAPRRPGQGDHHPRAGDGRPRSALPKKCPPSSRTAGTASQCATKHGLWSSDSIVPGQGHPSARVHRAPSPGSAGDQHEAPLRRSATRRSNLVLQSCQGYPSATRQRAPTVHGGNPIEHQARGSGQRGGTATCEAEDRLWCPKCRTPAGWTGTAAPVRRSTLVDLPHLFASCLRGRYPGCLVREGGVEPPHPFEYTDLNRARLPIPPLAHHPAEAA